MPRFILIDADTGYVFGDTADLSGLNVNPESATEAARLIDTMVIGEHGRIYSEVSRRALNGRTGYLVYRADDGSNWPVPAVIDGQDPETIAAIEQNCEFVAAVLCQDEAA